LTKIKIIETILSSIFYDERLSTKTLKGINCNQLDEIYNYLYKQKILQLSYNVLTQLLHSKEEYDEGILLKAAEYIKKTNSRDSMLREGLYSLSNTLTQNGIEHISLKGPLFSEIYYKSSGKRVSGDIDLLINKSDVPRVKDILINAGYYVDQDLFEKSVKHHYHFEAKKTTSHLKFIGI
jgi:hypothetical protein